MPLWNKLALYAIGFWLGKFFLDSSKVTGDSQEAIQKAHGNLRLGLLTAPCGTTWLCWYGDVNFAAVLALGWALLRYEKNKEKN